MRRLEAERKLRSMMEKPVPYEIVRGGISITITKDVYPTSELSELLVQVMDDASLGLGKGSRVLDYGSGTGFLAIQAALRGAAVVAIDISDAAIACGRLNAERHNVLDRISFRRSENLDAIKTGEQFDAVFAGMPWDDAAVNEIVERSLYDPDFTMRQSLFRSLPNLLRPKGVVVLSSYEGHKSLYPEILGPPSLSKRVFASRLIKGTVHQAIVINI